MNIIEEKDMSEINLIKPLWEKLNEVHLKQSVYFKNKYESFTFEERIESILKKAQHGKIKLDMIYNEKENRHVGYCLSSIQEEVGEIESIFIEENYRKSGLGDKLMSKSLKWFEENSITNIEINVVYANDSALPFYQKHGFFIGNYILRRQK